MGLEALDTSNSQDRFQKQFRYHHGNLRATLIEAALVILYEEGIEALSLRSIARKSNVSQAAPYSHFKNKKELVSAVAETGFQKMALQMADDAANSATTRDQIEKLMISYARFATENKPLFQLMFSNEVFTNNENTTLTMSENKAYDLINAALNKNAHNAAYVPFMSVALWSLCHGLTNLILSDKVTPAQFNTASVDALIRNIMKVIPVEV